MSTFDEYFAKPISKKIVLVEMDIGQSQVFFANYRAGVYFVNFDNLYPDSTKILIADWLVSGAGTIAVTTLIGSMKSDGVAIARVNDVSTCVSTENSFFSSGEYLYIHLLNGEPPSIHDIEIGKTFGVYKGNAEDSPNGAGVYGGFHYDQRLLTVPSLSKSKDPLFFGKISYDSATIEIDNTDGEYDTWTSDNDVFGGEARILLGFEDIDYDEFRTAFVGFMETVVTGPNITQVTIQDKRKQLSRAIPNNVFSQSVFSDLRDEDVGKAIPWGYGPVNNAAVTNTNYNESSPDTYTFKIVDVADHANGIDSVDAAYIDDVSATIESTDLTNGTFNLYGSAFTNVSETLKVTCDFGGFVDSDSNMIKNGLDVIQDILSVLYSYTDTATFYNVDDWDTATALAFDIGLYVTESTKTIDIIEQISSSMLGNFIVEDSGVFTYRIYDPGRYPSQTITANELFSTPVYSDNPTEILTSSKIGYAQDYDKEQFQYYHDTTNESTNFGIFNTYLEKVYDTLLTTKADAISFSNNLFEISGQVQRIFSIQTALQTVKREIGDFIWVYVDRPVNTMLGRVKAEIIDITKNLDNSKVNITCRFIESDPVDTEIKHSVYVHPRTSLLDGSSYYSDPAASPDNEAYYGEPKDEVI